jgi:hypothetical protein
MPQSIVRIDNDQKRLIDQENEDENFLNYNIGNKKNKGYQNTKRTIKFLSSCGNTRVQRAVLNSADDSVYKSICNAFFNLAENPDIRISEQRKRQLKPHHFRIRKLISAKIPIRRKRILIQKGGGIFLGTILPIVLTTALSYLGSKLFPKKNE